MVKQWLLAALMVFCSTPLMAEGDPAPLRNVTFLVNRLAPDDFFFRELSVGFEQLKEQKFVDNVTVIGYDDNAQRLRSAFDAALQNSDAIIMNYMPQSDVAYFAAQAGNKDLPLVFVLTRPAPSILSSYKNVFFVSQDDVQSGVGQGLLVSRYLSRHPEVDKNNDATINVLNLTGAGYAAPEEAERLAWMFNTINHYPGSQYKAKEVGNYVARYLQDKARDYVMGLARDGQLEQVEVVVAQDDKMALGAADAMQSLGLDIPVFARGASPVDKQYIREGKLAGTVESLPRQVSYYAGRIAYNYVNHLDINSGIPYRIYKNSIELPYKVVMSENLH